MFQSVNFSIINIQESNLEAKFALAKKHGFKAVELGPDEVLDTGVDTVKMLLEKYDIRCVSNFSMPFHPIFTEEKEYASGLEKLDLQAEAMAELGCYRCILFLFPSSKTRKYEENYKFHVDRIAPVAAILGKYGIHLGLEPIGSKVMRDDGYPFIYTAEEMLKLAADCGDNCGLLLDAFHWYCGDYNRDLFSNIGDPEKIVNVHINDALPGERNEMDDRPRALPGETGVIDLKFWLDSLYKMGYKGPVVCEPFSDRLAQAQSDDERVRLVKQYMDLVWDPKYDT